MKTADVVDDRDSDFGATRSCCSCWTWRMRWLRPASCVPGAPDGSLLRVKRMSRYVRDCGLVERRGGVLRDDRDDPVMATIAYADGDHIARADRARYTDRFFATTPIFK